MKIKILLNMKNYKFNINAHWIYVFNHFFTWITYQRLPIIQWALLVVPMKSGIHSVLRLSHLQIEWKVANRSGPWISRSNADHGCMFRDQMLASPYRILFHDTMRPRVLVKVFKNIQIKCTLEETSGILIYSIPSLLECN